MPYTIENQILKNHTQNSCFISTWTISNIPETVTQIGNEAFIFHRQLTKIRIPESVTQIDAKAFKGCAKLTQINIPKNVTKIARETFSICSGLSKINIPEGVTEIASKAFYNCSNLTQINIPESVTQIGTEAFKGCIKLTQLTIPNGVTEIGRCAFSLCENLTQINILQGVTEIGREVFKDTTGLTQMTIPKSVTEIDWYAFEYCYNLTQVTILGSMTKIGRYTFDHCDNLKRIVVSSNNQAARLPDWLKDKVTCYYLRHKQNINDIKHSQLALFSSARLLNVFQSSLINRDVTGLIYLFLSFKDMITLSCIYTGLKPIKDVAQSIQAVKYKGIIPKIKPTSAIKTSFLQQYTPNENDNELTPYQRSLNHYKLNLKKKITQTVHESKPHNNNRIMQCRIL